MSIKQSLNRLLDRIYELVVGKPVHPNLLVEAIRASLENAMDSAQNDRQLLLLQEQLSEEDRSFLQRRLYQHVDEIEDSLAEMDLVIADHVRLDEGRLMVGTYDLERLMDELLKPAHGCVQSGWAVLNLSRRHTSS